MENRSRTSIFRKLIFSKTMTWDYIHVLPRWLNIWSWIISLRTRRSCLKMDYDLKSNILRRTLRILRILRIHSIWPMKCLCEYTVIHVWLVYFFSRGDWIILILFWFSISSLFWFCLKMCKKLFKRLNKFFSGNFSVYLIFFF